MDQPGAVGHGLAVLLIHMGGEEVPDEAGEEVNIALGEGFGEGEFLSDGETQGIHGVSSSPLPLRGRMFYGSIVPSFSRKHIGRSPNVLV